MSDFSVKQAIDTLHANATEMKKLADDMYELRILHNATKIKLADKEQDARTKYFNKTTELPIRASEFRDFIKWETYQELAAEQKLANEIKIKTEKLHTLEQLVNINKFVERLALIETNL